MPNLKVRVKWGRELFPEVEVNTDEQPMLFKAQLFALTGVQPARQKVMCKGGILRDDEWNLQLKEGAMVLLMGSKEEVPEKPKEQVKFIEDMDEEEIATITEMPAGLKNLGNTCYMNATLQCLRSVPELREALNVFKAPQSSDESLASMGSMATAMTSAIQFEFKQMERGSSVTPILLLQTLHRAFPQFLQMGENGTYRQQDANECWCELLKMLQQKLPATTANKITATPTPTPTADATKKEANAKTHSSFIEQFFGGTFEVTMNCSESSDEEASVSKENFLQLSCFISPEVRYMLSGLKSKMKENLTKHSEFLGRDAKFSRSYLISRLPAYLTVQFVRFQYKGKEGINAKVLKDIKFPIDFDAFELCTDELRNKLCPMRAKFKLLEDQKLAAAAEAPVTGDQHHEQSKKDTNDKKDRGTLSSFDSEHFESYWFEDDFGSNNSGYYTLQAVLTHKGRSSSSGHYVAWVKHNNDVWFKFDDDDVSSVSSEEILRLSGGGDWHCAYVLLYGPKLLPKNVKSVAENLADATQAATVTSPTPK